MTAIILTLLISLMGIFLKPFAERLAQAIMPDPTKVIRLVKIFIITVFRYGTPIAFIIYYCVSFDISKLFIIIICFQFLAITVQLTIDIVQYMTQPYRDHIAVTRGLADTQKHMIDFQKKTAETHIKLVDKIIDAFEGRNNNA